MGLRDGKKQPWNFRLDLITKLTSHERDKVKDDARERHITIYQMERTYGSYDFVYDTLEDVRRGEGQGFIL